MKHTYSFSISLLLSFIYLFHASAQPYVIKRLGVEDGTVQQLCSQCHSKIKKGILMDSNRIWS